MEIQFEYVELKSLKTPAREFLPPLPEHDREVLKEDIKTHGIETPFIINKDGTIIDGNNRRLIAQELGIKKVNAFRYSRNLSEKEQEEVTLRLNLHRRHLGLQERFEFEKRLVGLAGARIDAREEEDSVAKEDAPKVGRPKKQKSVRSLAKESGVAPAKVQRVLDFEKAVEKYTDLADKPHRAAIKEYQRRESITATGKEYDSVDAKIKNINRYVKEITDDIILDGLLRHISRYVTHAAYRDKVEAIAEKIKEGDIEKPKNPGAEVVNAYKKLYGFPVTDRTWNKVFFPQAIEPANMLLAEFNNDVDATIKCVEFTCKEMQELGLNWNLRTVLKRLPQYKKAVAARLEKGGER